FDYIATVRPATGAPITDDHDWPLNNITTSLKWVMDQLPDGGIQALLTALLPKRTFQKSDFIRIPDVPGGLIVNFIRNASVTSNAQGDATITVTYPAQFPTQACGSAFWLVDEAGNPYPATATCQGGTPGQSVMNITVRGVGSARTCAVSGFIVGN
ncbi:MAG: hypothetical protein ACRC91_18805, partial [Aeromonas sp.]